MTKKQELFKSVTVLVLICFAVSAALAVVHSFTEPVSARNAALREDEARRQVLPDAASFEEVEAALPESVLSCYLGKAADGGALGYVFLVEGRGFGGPIQVLCAIGTDGRIVRCHTLDVSGETKTLGGKTADSAYTDQYIGKDAALSGVNTISQATVTSTAYRGCVEEAFRAYAQIREGK